ncbi:Fic family protein [Solidesulfovibrio sp. C21]|uniref:Fic family protein n=1 Tax=Solidesulfovibrio sp. C21 TaxID=3398613 RepID=UPI0039FDCF68
MDKIMDTTTDAIHKVLTYKSGNFAFSRAYDRSRIETELKVFHARYDIIARLPILPNWAATLDEELIRKSIFSTAAIEGNPLDESEVDKIIGQDSVSAAPQDFEREIVNLKEAHARYLAGAKRQAPFLLSEELIREVHGIITNGIREEENTPGRYRNQLVKVGNPDHGGTYVPPKILEDVKTLMREFVAWINSPEMLQEDPLIRAALAHFHLGKIHPFRDGNGRTARMVEAMILSAARYIYIPNALWNYYYKNIHEYFIVFSKTEKDRSLSMDSFLNFFIVALNSSLGSLLSSTISILKPILLQNYVSFLKNSQQSITQRQYDLVWLLLSNPVVDISSAFLKKTLPFSQLYKTVTEKTIKRDINKLLEHAVLVKTDGKIRLNYDLARLG